MQWYLAKQKDGEEEEEEEEEDETQEKMAGGRYFFTPLYLAVTCLTLVLPEEYVCRFSGRCLLEGFRILLLLVRQWIHVYVSLQRLLSSTTVVWLVLLVMMHFVLCLSVVGKPATRSASWSVWIRRTSRCVGFLAVFP